MARDLNIAIVSGQIIDEPELRTIKNSKKILSFTLKVVEKFTLADGSPGSHENFFIVEALGRNAEIYHRDLVRGSMYQISGYLRADLVSGTDRVKIRCYNIQTAD